MKFSGRLLSEHQIHVSALAAEWIEIRRFWDVSDILRVSALAAEWIEIIQQQYPQQLIQRLRPRGGVD